MTGVIIRRDEERQIQKEDCVKTQGEDFHLQVKKMLEGTSSVYMSVLGFQPSEL